ncbi:MAG: OmpA family protein [Chitinophagaceae bacterium]
MLYKFLLCALLLSLRVHSQNLLVNESFEEENICTEYTQNCAPEAWISTTLTSDYYFQDYKLAHTGSHFTGLIVGNTRTKAKRSYLRTRLLCALRPGKQYLLEFFVLSRHKALDSVGIYFSPTDILAEKKVVAQLRPQLIYRDTALADLKKPDSLSWRKASFIYTATGGEIFITLGSFKRTDPAFTLPADILGNFYVYIDDISLKPLDTHELLCADAAKVKEDMYNESERHELLVKKARLYRNYPPIVEKPSLTILLKIDTLIIPDILFATASAKLNELSTGVLDSFSAAVKSKPFDSLIVAGHTDSVGTLIYNMKLSADRAKAVAAYITGKATINQRKLLVRYHAYLHPVASNLTPQGRQRNRRVEIFLYRHE